MTLVKRGTQFSLDYIYIIVTLITHGGPLIPHWAEPVTRLLINTIDNNNNNKILPSFFY